MSGRMRAGANFSACMREGSISVPRGAYQKPESGNSAARLILQGSKSCDAGRIRAALDEGELRVFVERLHELGRSARFRRSCLQMRQDCSNGVALGDEGNHAELTAALTLYGVGKIHPSDEARPASPQAGALLR